jgi:hypothetical protein
MAEYVTKIRTENGDMQIDYNALANLPETDKTLSKKNKAADAKATGDAIAQLSSDVSTLEATKADLEYVNQLQNNLDPEGYMAQLNQKAEKEYVDTQLALKSDKTYVDTQLALKATSKDVNNQLALKATTEYVDEQLALKATVEAVDGKLSKSGGTMSGNLNMGSKKITSLATPTSNTDAATKSYVDGKYLFVENVVLTTEWVGETAPYTQEISVSNIKSTDHPHISPIYSETLDTAKLQMDAWGLVSKAEAMSGKIKFTCFYDKPTVEITMQIEVHR